MAESVNKNFSKFLSTEFFGEVEFPRLIEGVTGFIEDFFGYKSIAGMSVEALRTYSKRFDQFRYIPKATGDLQKLMQAISQSKSTTEVFNQVVKLAGDGSASFKFFGMVGITVLAPHVKAFGYIKNICSVYSAAIAIFSSLPELYTLLFSTKIDDADPHADQKRSAKNWSIAKHVCILTMSGCSIGLNGLGGLHSWVGKAIEAAGKQTIPKGFFTGCSLIATLGSIASRAIP